MVRQRQYAPTIYYVPDDRDRGAHLESVRQAARLRDVWEIHRHRAEEDCDGGCEFSGE